MAKKQYSEEVSRYAHMLAAMGTEPRLRIVQLLLTFHPKGMVVGQLGGKLEIPNSTLSHHLDKLKRQGLVNVRREGTFLWYTANTEALQELSTLSLRRALYRGQSIRPKKINPFWQQENPMSKEIKEVVREKYGQAALRVHTGGISCCGASLAGDGCCDPITANSTTRAGPADSRRALKASLGCGNPTALAQLNAGETVLDLGSGGGIDVLLSAKRVGPTGKAYGLDMTDEMLALARENQHKSGIENVEFLKGEIENIPAA